MAPSLSADGRVVAFMTDATNLAPDDGGAGDQDVYVPDVQAGDRARLARDGGFGDPGDGASIDPSVSADGRLVAFTSAATNLTDQDADGFNDVFVRDRVTGTTTYVSRPSGFAGPGGDGPSFAPSISADGRFVAFASTATNLSPDDTSDRTKCLHPGTPRPEPRRSSPGRAAAAGPRAGRARRVGRARRAPPTAATWRSS